MCTLEGKLGLCLQGTHPSLHVSGARSQYPQAVVNHAVVSHAQVTHLDNFICGEELGIEVNPKCGNCKCGKC